MVEAESSGVVTVLSRAATEDAPASGRWMVEAETRLPARSGSAFPGFGRITGMDVGPQGTVYVFDAEDRVVTGISPEGAVQRRFGAVPGAPVRFSGSASSVLALSDGRIVVPDPELRTFHVFDVEGSHTDIPLFGPLDDPETMAVAWSVLPDDRIVVRALSILLTSEDLPDSHLITFDPATQVWDTLAQLGSHLSLSGGGRDTFFGRESAWVLRDDGASILGTSDALRFRVLDSDGRTARIASIAAPRRRISYEDRVAIRTVLAREADSADTSLHAAGSRAAMIEFGEFYPAWMSLAAGPRSTLWVQSPAATSPQVEGRADFGKWKDPAWYVLDPQGRVMDRVVLPPGFVPMASHGDQMYAPMADSSGVVSVLRLVVRPPAGLR